LDLQVHLGTTILKLMMRVTQEVKLIILVKVTQEVKLIILVKLTKEVKLMLMRVKLCKV
jgi:hypothetical protein